MASDDSDEWYRKAPPPQAQAFDFSSSPELSPVSQRGSLPGTPTLAAYLDGMEGNSGSPMSLDSLPSPTEPFYEGDSLDALIQVSGGTPPPLGLSSDADRDSSDEDDDELFIDSVLRHRRVDPVIVVIYHRPECVPVAYAFRKSFINNQSVLHDFAREKGVTITVDLFISSFLLSEHSSNVGHKAFFKEWDRWLATPDAIANNLITPIDDRNKQSSMVLRDGSRLVQLFS